MGQLPCVRPVSIVLLFCPIVKSNSVCHRSLFQDGQIPLWKEYHKERLASEIYHFGCSWLKCLKLFLMNFLFELNLRIGLLMVNNIGQQFQKIWHANSFLSFYFWLLIGCHFYSNLLFAFVGLFQFSVKFFHLYTWRYLLLQVNEYAGIIFTN